MPGNTKSVLIIGATGPLGLRCLRHLAEEPSVTHLHVLCRSPAKLSSSDTSVCDSIIMGDARITRDVEEAITTSTADYVILVTGNGMDLHKSDTREKTGRALADVMQKPTFQHVKAVVVSSHGAGETRINVGMGIGMIISYHIRHVLADHTRQEQAFEGVKERTLIVRPTGLTNDKGGKAVVEFDGEKKCPTMSIDRSDVAAWITRQIARDFDGRKVCLTNAK